jgi:hypothetical protein
VLDNPERQITVEDAWEELLSWGEAAVSAELHASLPGCIEMTVAGYLRGVELRDEQIGATQGRTIRGLAFRIAEAKFWVPDDPVRVMFVDRKSSVGARYRMLHFIGQEASLNVTMFDDPSQWHLTEHLAD